MASRMGLSDSLSEELSDPTFRPGHLNSSAAAQRKVVPFDWVSYDPEQLNLLLNAVNYRAEHTFESGATSLTITSPEQARAQLLRRDLDYRFRLNTISRSKKHKSNNFEKHVRQGMRWRGWEQCPWYIYLGNGARTPTDAEHQAYVARIHTASTSASASAGRVVINLVDDTPPVAVPFGAAVQTGVAIPPKPILPAHPCMTMTKPKGPLYPIKHPFTEAQIKAHTDNNPGTSIPNLLKKLFDPVDSPNNPLWMYKCVGIVCREIDAASACLKTDEWIRRVLEDLQWQGHCIGFIPRVGNREDGVYILSTAFDKNVKVFTLLDGGSVPAEYVTPDEAKTYTETKAKFDAAQAAYDAAYKQLKHWKDTYGALADTIIPRALDPEDEEVAMLDSSDMAKAGILNQEERKRKLLAEAVCVDCQDSKCGCVVLTKPAPKIVKTEPSSSSSAVVVP